MNKLILIDGNSLLFRAYFAMRPMVTSKGIHTQGVFAFVNMLGKILNDYEPTHMAVAFDLKGGTFRHDVYKDYKAGRLKTPPELLSQIPLLHDVLDAMNIAVLEVPQYEADDIIGTVAARAEKDGLDTLVISGDKDELQLIGPHVNVLINKRGMSEFDLYDIDAMRERYNLTPEQFIDLKGLMGDSSDNIPGVPGIGEKKGIALLEQYGTLENLIDHADEVKGKMGEKLRENIEVARMSKWLATINTQAPVEYKHAVLERGKLTVPYTHAMSKFTVIVVAGDGFTSTDLDNAKVTLHDMQTRGTFTAPSAEVSATGTADVTMYGNKRADDANQRAFEAVVLPTTSLAKDKHLATITMASTSFLIKYWICDICSSISPLADCTFTSAPRSRAVATKTSLSLCHLSITKESKHMPIWILSCSSVLRDLVPSASLPHPVKRATLIRRAIILHKKLLVIPSPCTPSV